KAIVIPTVITYSLIFIIGTVGNICTCVVIIRNKSMHTHTNFYLFSLALSDLLVLSLVHLIDIITSDALRILLSARYCERWLAILSPATISVLAKNITSLFDDHRHVDNLGRLRYAHGLCEDLIVSEDGKTLKNTQFCAMDVDQPEQQKRLIYFAFIAFFLAPAILITMMYCQIGTRIASRDSLLCVDKKQMKTKSTPTVTKMLISVVVSFFICWLPFHIQRLLSLFISYYEGQVSPAVEVLFSLVYYISGCCYYSNSAINPILYNLFSAKYRKAFCMTILGRRIAEKIRPQWFALRSK
ncbi:7 transmembrane receptor, partial [Ostertagia ostertagi]